VRRLQIAKLGVRPRTRGEGKDDLWLAYGKVTCYGKPGSVTVRRSPLERQGYGDYGEKSSRGKSVFLARVRAALKIPKKGGVQEKRFSLLVGGEKRTSPRPQE